MNSLIVYLLSQSGASPEELKVAHRDLPKFGNPRQIPQADPRLQAKGQEQVDESQSTSLRSMRSGTLLNGKGQRRPAR